MKCLFCDEETDDRCDECDSATCPQHNDAGLCPSCDDSDDDEESDR